MRLLLYYRTAADGTRDGLRRMEEEPTGSRGFPSVRSISLSLPTTIHQLTIPTYPSDGIINERDEDGSLIWTKLHDHVVHRFQRTPGKLIEVDLANGTLVDSIVQREMTCKLKSFLLRFYTLYIHKDFTFRVIEPFKGIRTRVRRIVLAPQTSPLNPSVQPNC